MEAKAEQARQEEEKREEEAERKRLEKERKSKWKKSERSKKIEKALNEGFPWGVELNDLEGGSHDSQDKTNEEV